MWKRVVVVLGGLIVVFVVGTLSALMLRPVKMAPATSVTVDRNAERVARGEYLFYRHSCVDCHSETDETRFGYPPKPGGLGKGFLFPEFFDVPGTLAAPNLTPDPETGSGNWTDGQLIRAIREGIGHDDRVLFPMMPYTEYQEMSDRDVQDIVAFIRSLPPVRNPLPAAQINFFVKLMVKSVPKPVGSVPEPNTSDPVAYGAYLTKTMGCKFCHTPAEHGELDVDRVFAGGQEFLLAPGARSVSANITPDTETGLGKLGEQEFLDKFYQYKEYLETGPPVIEPSRNSAMPWLSYARLAPEDLKAIYAYLRTVKPVNNAVVTHPDSPEEKQLREKSK